MNKELTPFNKAGYTKDTKFRMKHYFGKFKKGAVVWLSWDDKEVEITFEELYNLQQQITKLLGEE